MTCPAENTWLRYLGGGLEQDASHELERHLDQCAECRLLYAGMARDERAAETQHDGARPLASPSAPLERGATVGRYIILGVLGRGGMGIVYKAFDPELDRAIALKLVGVGGLRAEPEDARLRLLREAKTLARLSHPNVVAVHDVGAYGKDLFVAMEFVAGTTLRHWLRAEPRKPREILAVFRAAGAGLAAAHRLGIVHRDFKPENVMVEEDGRVRVLDFGLARSFEHALSRPSLPSVVAARGHSSEVDAHSDLTRDGAIVGTPPYMAPEQDAGGDVDARSDQFSFCAALYEALYGVRPFEGETYAAMSQRRIAGEVRPPPATRGIPGRVRRALLRGLRPDPASRHASMEALLVELGAHRWSSRTRIAIAALAVAALGAGGAAVWVAASSPPSVEESCALAADDIKRVWNPSRREELLRSLTRANVPDARGFTDRVAARIDHWANEWSTRRTQLCQQTMLSDRDQSQDLAQQLTCLRRRLSGLDGAVSVLTHTTVPEIAHTADEVIARIATPSSCDSFERLTVTDEMRTRWAPVLQGVVQARVALAAGRTEEAEHTAHATVATARTIREPEVLAAALQTLGMVQAERGQYAEARKHLLEAIRLATPARENVLVLDSWLAIIGMAFAGHDTELESAIFAAEVAAQQVPKDEPIHCHLAYKIGSVRALHGAADVAVPLLEQAIACWRKHGEAKHRNDIAGAENTLGLIYSSRGEWHEAKRALERALAAWEAIGRPHANTVHTLSALGEIAIARGDNAAAEPLLRRALAVAEALGETGNPVLGDAEGHLAYLLIRTQRCAEAQPLLERAQRHHAAIHGEQSSKVAGILLGKAMCELEAGRAARAIELLAIAKPLADAKPVSLTQIALTDFTLARALVATNGSKQRALELAERAAEKLRSHRGLALHLADVEAWLAKHRVALAPRR